MASLKEAAQAKAAAARQPAAQEEASVKMNHPTMDSAGASTRLAYNPAPPQKRFDFLKRFSRVPGLRAKGAALAAQQ